MGDAVLEGPIEGDPFQILGGFDLSASGYTGAEFFFSGIAIKFEA